ncbi:hypothetical protein SAMN04488018_11262 [Myroides marinus]|uniref:Uncharacterized protein n=1 Tax=Myroides marinus TaxID=703342 RepID=A0A1H6WFC6_9FLAO|nr:hypothetical protein [Myroides marinus]SEJ11035.1 hypothetical protein SAMN04488018_11262 [Myroides marinus]
MKLNTTNRGNLPNPKELKELCKSLATLDAILCQDWEYRYYLYNHIWSDDEEFFQMRDGEGNDMVILFRNDGVVINGFDHELYDFEESLPNKEDLTAGLPSQYIEFIFGEYISGIGTTYCIWSDNNQQWTIGQVDNQQDGSDDQLYIFDNNPDTYINWATNYYFDEEEESMTAQKKEIIRQIYQGTTLTKEMILTLNPELEDWELLKEDIIEINYPHTL